MTRRRRRQVLGVLVLLLYAVTWAGGWRTHAREIDASARARYQRAQAQNARRYAGGEVPVYAELREGGPATGVNWAVPLLPGVLVADSYEVLGPLSGRGSAKVLLYYGGGTVVVCELWGWLA